MFNRRMYFAALLALAFTVLGIWTSPSYAAATVDRAVCSTADKSGGDPAKCDGQELIDSATQEVAKLYQGNILVVQSVGGTANAITGSTSPAATTLVDGEMRQIKPALNNTSSVTYNDNSTGAKQVVSAAGGALGSGDLQSTTVYILRYYAANDEWRVLTNLGTGTASASNAYVTIGNTGSLSAERALTAGTCVSVTDGGANSTATVAVASCSSANLRTAVTDETGSGLAVFATSPTLTTPILGVASATTVNKVTITAPATGATLTIPDGVTFTGPASSGTAMTLGNTETVTGVKTFGSTGAVGRLKIAGTTSGTTTLDASATASGTLTLPAATDTLVGKATTDTLTNKTFDTAGTGNSFSINGVAVTANTGTGAVVRQASPSITTPTISSGGAAFSGSTSGTTTVAASATASGTLTLPAATDTLVGKATTDTLTNKTISGASNTLSNIGNAALTNSATTVNSQTCTLGSTCTVTVPVSTGVTGLGTGVATALATPSSANLASAITDETGSGLAVFATSPSLTTPAIGSGGMTMAGSSSGTTTVAASATASGTLTLPAATDTLVGKATTDTLTNKSLSLGSNTLTATSAQIATATSDETGSGALVFGTSPTFTTGVTLGSDTLSDFTGLGLALSGGALGLDATGATDEFCLTYEATGPTTEWQACGGGGGGGSPGGSNGQIQYNNAGAFDGFTMSGDVTVNTSTGAATIGANAVTNAKAAQMATNTIKGNNTGGPSDPLDLTVTQVSTLLAGAGLGVDSNGKLAPSIATTTKTGAYTVVLADRGSVVAIGTNSVTLTLTAAATLGDGFWFVAANDNAAGSTNTLIIDPNSSETIDGVSTSTDYSGVVRLVYTNGTNWFSRILRGGYVQFDANGNFIMPNNATSIRTEGWGGGGGGGGGQSGATATARTGGTGGGGGGYAVFDIAANLWGSSGSTIAVVIGTAGTGGTGTSGASGGNGGAGGNTTFGGAVIAAGGGGGAGGAGAARGGGTGGGRWNAGNTAPTAASAGGSNNTTNTAGDWVAGGGSTTNVNTNPMPAHLGGGAGGGTLTAGGAGGPGGTSGFGGPGGGGGAGITTGNAAAAGGAGGANGSYSSSGGGGSAGGTNAGTSGTAGVANSFSGGSGGGGGGTNGTSTCGAGGAGGAPAGGGGGGAACLTGTAGGVGGAGAIGRLRIWYSEVVPANDNLPADEAMAA